MVIVPQKVTELTRRSTEAIDLTDNKVKKMIIRFCYVYATFIVLLTIQCIIR
jgi:hypothetical protein